MICFIRLRHFDKLSFFALSLWVLGISLVFFELFAQTHIAGLKVYFFEISTIVSSIVKLHFRHLFTGILANIKQMRISCSWLKSQVRIVNCFVFLLGIIIFNNLLNHIRNNHFLIFIFKIQTFWIFSVIYAWEIILFSGIIFRKATFFFGGRR